MSNASGAALPMKSPVGYYHRKFRDALVRASVADDFDDAIKEWQVLEVRENEPTRCICTHPIKEKCFMQHVEKKSILLCVGNCCFQQFFPPEQLQRADELRAEKAPRFQCRLCEKHYRGASSLKDGVCSACRRTHLKCRTCGAYFACEGDERRWEKSCRACYRRARGFA
jgi:hypothetical protein